MTDCDVTSVTARLLPLALPGALVLLAEDSTAASVVDMAATLVLPLATSAVAPTTLPVTARLRP